MSEKFPTTPEQSNNKDNPIIERIKAESGDSEIVEKLLNIPNTDFQSLVLAVFNEKAEKTKVSNILSTIERSNFVQPSDVESRDLISFDSLAYRTLPKRYKGVELSPVVPFAVNHVLGGISQNRVMSTSRNSEVISDPTTALALLCAKERTSLVKVDPKDSTEVTLATSQRVIRQDSVKKEGYSQHFKTFTLAVAGRDIGFERFEKENLSEHISVFLSIINSLNMEGGYLIEDVSVVFSNVGDNEGLTDMVNNILIPELQSNFTGVRFSFDNERKSNYYKNICYSMFATPSGSETPFSIAGGGVTDWSEKLVGSKKERFLVGSIGSETICRHFKK